MDLRIRSNEPHAFFRNAIMRQTGAISHYLRMVTNEILFDLDTNLQNVKLFLRKADSKQLAKENQFLALYLNFQRASRIAEHQTIRTPAGNLVFNPSIGGGRIAPAFVNIGQITQKE